MKILKILIITLIFTGCAHTERFVHLAKHASLKVVKVTIPRGERTAFGAGVFITNRGHILTVAHLCRNGAKTATVELAYNDRLYPATVVFVQESMDLALLKIDEYTPHYAKLASLTDSRVGQEVLAIGHPLGLDWTVTHGIISQIRQNVLVYENFIQTDAAISPGNSGGPLFNRSGRLVGISSYIRSPSETEPIQVGLNMAASLTSIYQFLETFRGL